MIHQFHSHAKLNLFLKVLGKTNSGFHEISSLILPLKFADKITIESGSSSTDKLKINASLSKDLKFHLLGNSEEFRELLESESSLLNAASKSFFVMSEKLKVSSEFDSLLSNNLVFDLVKNIPPEAGLGGGSSNAAWVLEALNIKFGNYLTKSDLLSLAQDIGSDVSAQLFGKACYVQGRGEDVTEIKFDSDSLKFIDKLGVLLIKPPFGSPTKKAFEDLNAKTLNTVEELKTVRQKTKLSKLNFLNCSNEDLINKKKLKISTKLFFKSIENDFDLKFKLSNDNHKDLEDDPVSSDQLYGFVDKSLKILQNSNKLRNNFFHLLAGSGSTRAVIFEDKAELKLFADHVREKLPSSFLIVETGFETDRFD